MSSKKESATAEDGPDWNAQDGHAYEGSALELWLVTKAASRRKRDWSPHLSPNLLLRGNPQPERSWCPPRHGTGALRPISRGSSQPRSKGIGVQVLGNAGELQQLCERSPQDAGAKVSWNAEMIGFTDKVCTVQRTGDPSHTNFGYAMI